MDIAHQGTYIRMLQLKQMCEILLVNVNNMALPVNQQKRRSVN